MDAKWTTVLGCVLLVEKRFIAMMTNETIAMIRHHFGTPYAAFVYHLSTPVALVRILLFVARNTNRAALVRHKSAGADEGVALFAFKALFVPLLVIELILLLTYFKNISAPITFDPVESLVASGTVESFVLERESLLDQVQIAQRAKEAGVVPVLVLVRELLMIGANKFFTCEASVRKVGLVAAYAIRFIVVQNVS